MQYAIWQGITYEVQEFIYNAGGQITFVRLRLAADVVTAPVAFADVEITPFPSQSPPFGGGGGAGGGSGSGAGILVSQTAPVGPVPGQTWYNSSNQTVAGVPAGNYAVWNGSAWMVIGTVAPVNLISQATTPVSPTQGLVWQNTSAGTLAGIPAGGYGVWNGTTWVNIGASPPTSVQGTAVTLTGDVTGSGQGVINTALAPTGVTAGTFGSATAVPVVTVDAKGRITAISTQAATGGGGVAGVSEIDVNGVGDLVGIVNLQGSAISRLGNIVNFDAYATDAELLAAIAAHNAAADPHAQYLLGTEVYGASYREQITAPLSPALGQIWRNTSASTVAGVPAGQFGIWNGTTWTPQANTAFTTAVTGVKSLNAVVGDVILTPGSNIAINPSGQNIGISAIVGFASDTAPLNPYPGQVWYNSFASTVSGVPSGRFGVWNGTSWISVGTEAPEGSLIVSGAVPTDPVQGQTWLNISGGTLAGITTGSHGVWNGTSWVNVGIAPPSTVTAGVTLIGFAVSNSAAITLLASPTHQLQKLNTKIFDTFAGYNTTTGVYTVTQLGRWLWNFTTRWSEASGSVALNTYCTVNSTVVTPADIVAPPNTPFASVGASSRVLENGDQLRFYTAVSVDSAMEPGSLFVASQVQRVG